MNAANSCLRALAATLGCALIGGCTSWRTAQQFEGWTLYVRDGSSVDANSFEDALTPAFEVVEQHLGPFERDVRVHAFDGSVRLSSGNRGEIVSGKSGGELETPSGLGMARVHAFHARGQGLFSPGGIYLGTAETSTAVHELVHARLAEQTPELPLWFEEGLATFYADGALARAGHEQRWVIDGLSFWPLRELRASAIDQAKLEQLLELRPGDEHNVSDNLLVHFLGWALVFDLVQEQPEADWSEWLACFQRDPGSARERLERSLDPARCDAWFDARLRSPDPGQRLAAVCGTWKLAEPHMVDRLLAALEQERDPEVRVALAVNLLAGESESGSPFERRWSVRRAVLRVLKDAQLVDPEEQAATRTLYEVYRGYRSQHTAETALDRLARFWRE